MNKLFVFSFLCLFLFSKSDAQFKAVDVEEAYVEEYWEDGVVLGIDCNEITISSIEFCARHDIYRINGFIDVPFYNNSLSETHVDISIKSSKDSLLFNQRTNRFGLFTIYLKKDEYAELGTYCITKIKVTPGIRNLPPPKRFHRK